MFKRYLFLTPANHIIRVSRTESLCQAYQNLFDLTKNADNLLKSRKLLLDLLDSGLALSARHASDLHNSLESAYLRYYNVNNELSYLVHAADHFQKSLASKCTLYSYIVTATLNLSIALHLMAGQAVRDTFTSTMCLSTALLHFSKASELVKV